MDLFGLGKIGSIGVISAVVVAVGGGVAWYVIDSIGDAREERLRKEALEDRLKGIRDANERERQAKALPRLAKMWCAIDGTGTDCCKPDAVKLPKCTHDPASGDKRPD